MRLQLKLVALAFLACGMMSGGLAAAQPVESTIRTDLKPIIRIKPRYPQAAIEQRVTGHVTVEFTIGEVGAVRDLVVIDSSATIFDDAAVEAFRRWRYAQDPRVVGQRVRETMEFTIADLEAELSKTRSAPL